MSHFDENRAMNTAENIIRYAFEDPPKKGFCVVYDSANKAIFGIFENTGTRLGMESVGICVESIDDFDIGELERIGHTTVLNFLSHHLPVETRRYIAVQEKKSGLTVGHSPNTSIQSLVDGRMCANIKKTVGRAERLLSRLTNVRSISVVSPGGTDISLSTLGREFTSDAPIKSGEIGNLPIGEVYCAVVENGANGRIVVDGSMTDFGILDQTLTVHVKDGQYTKVQSHDISAKKFLLQKLETDKGSKILAEFGIGLVDNGHLSGVLVDDEKAGETCHFAFGDNTQFLCGKNRRGRNQSETHIDLVIHSPTITAHSEGGGEVNLVRDGEIQVGI
ncbi:MAG: aminopeptidase [Thermoplasmata archaeon]|nr:aminopeptidase [Thermoplasmata archaeon]